MAEQDAPLTVAQLNAALVPILTALGTMNDKFVALDEKVTALDEKVTALDEKVTALDEKVMALDEKVTALDEKVTALDEKVTGLQHRQDRIDARAFNAQVGRSENLAWVPLNDGTFPVAEFPETIANLLVAGNEKLPDGRDNTWNKRKGRALLAAFGDDSDNDTDREDGPTSRRQRIKVAKIMGVTQTQLNFAQLTL